MNKRHHIEFYLNTQRIKVASQDSTQTLAQYLRESKGLSGTKVVCEEGDCGACTVLLADLYECSQFEDIKYKSINSCIYPLYQLDGCHVLSIEGISQQKASSCNQINNIHHAMIQYNGSQCGYCTPGIVCGLAAMIDQSLDKNSETLTPQKVKNHLTGNLCRCTGYEPIINAGTSIELSKMKRLRDQHLNLEIYKELKKICAESLEVNQKVFVPHSLQEALKIKEQYPEIQIVAGATDLGVLKNKGRLKETEILSLRKIETLYEIKIVSSQTNLSNESFLEIGARVTLSQFLDRSPQILPETQNLIHIFASPQIKNSATIIGNILNASPIGDLIPHLMALDTSIVLTSLSEERVIPLSEFYLDYKKINIKTHEIATSLRIPTSAFQRFLKTYKVSTRKDLDISIVNFSFSCVLPSAQDQEQKITHCRLALGGVGPTVKRMISAEKLLESQNLKNSSLKKVFKEALDMTLSEIAPISDHRGSKEYRKQLIKNLFVKVYHDLVR
jgi:xanthine dehydrogenase small subunit